MSKLNIDVLADAVKNMSEDEFVNNESIIVDMLGSCNECCMREQCDENDESIRRKCKRMFYRFNKQESPKVYDLSINDTETLNDGVVFEDENGVKYKWGIEMLFFYARNINEWVELKIFSKRVLNQKYRVVDDE